VAELGIYDSFGILARRPHGNVDVPIGARPEGECERTDNDELDTLISLRK